jgi:RNA polymerase sigma-70 factor (ECF subfamily)
MNPVAPPNVDEAALAMLTAERVRAALDHLPAPQRQALELAYLDGMTFRQVALATGAAEGTAKSRLRLGLNRLAKELDTLRNDMERAELP